MSSKRGVTWPAQPHTLAKIEMLRAYLDAYFSILGRSKRNQTILYVDGFAGPGEYTNSRDGSPVKALAAASSAITSAGGDWKAANLYCAFIEPDGKRCENLRTRIAELQLHPRVKHLIIEKSFEEGIPELRALLPAPFEADAPLFVFIDPFGAKGVPFVLVRELLSSPCSEVLLNLDADGIARIHAAVDKDAGSPLLDTVFGDNSWREAVQPGDFNKTCRQILELYKAKLRSINKVKYVFSFEMRGRKDTLNYHLVFASKNPLGLEKMKEAMLRIDRSGGYQFSDGAVGQELLFRFDHPEDFAERLYLRFAGQTVAYDVLRDHALNETPFVNPKSMLRSLDGKGLLEVKSSNPKRRRSEFKEETLISIRFLESKPTLPPQELF